MKLSDIKTDGLESRFWSKVDKSNDKSDCWMWTAGRDDWGYGLISMRRTHQIKRNDKIRAHRLAYLLTYGEIPDGLLVCHTCDNPACCNPSHLWLGTNADNIRDMWDKGRRNQRGEAHPRAKLTQRDVDEIRARYRPWVVTQKALAREYGVGQPIIGKIINYQHWI
jgi:HNH endonuclease